jgi:mannose-6-phosphate isomerase-like protein (cupin superfamily)
VNADSGEVDGGYVMDARTRVVTVAREGGRRLARYSGGDLLVKISPVDDGAPLTIIESGREIGEKAGPARHRHGFLEVFYVLQGSYDFEVEGRTVHLEAGGLVKVPPFTVHGFRSDGQGRSRILTVAIPGGLERFFEEATTAASGTEMTDELREIGRRHGIEFLV